ncbi:VOC family protein [Pedobacter frigidisoli]|uniref:VOC family protein n=1 Tax=Pedobacter frigidisoli TaxID=2530455 RepID=A0A4R0P7C3_9SPHI|nr:VOC family protein [Pedobacter frigidisoli]TCD12909.1 VOC family protein [Pedobacter frigidisoli]
MKAPEYYQPIMPYLVVKDAAKFIEFIKEVFDADIKLVVPRADGTIMHAEATIDKGTIMFTDASDDYPPFPAGMFIFSPRAMAFYDKAMANGATSAQEPDEREYGLSAGFTDAWGNTWWVTVPGE